MSGPLLQNLCTPTLTPPPLFSPTICSSPQGQHSAPLRLNPPIMSTGSIPQTAAASPTQSTSLPKIPYPASPIQGLVQSCSHQSQHVRQPVLMEHSVSATLRVAEVEASRDPPPLFFFSLCLSLPLSLSGWWHSELFEQRWMYRTTWTDK